MFSMFDFFKNVCGHHPLQQDTALQAIYQTSFTVVHINQWELLNYRKKEQAFLGHLLLEQPCHAPRLAAKRFFISISIGTKSTGDKHSHNETCVGANIKENCCFPYEKGLI